MTTPLFRDDAYLTRTAAVVTGVTDRGGILLDQTVFYPTGGGQPGDRGTLTLGDGTVIEIATAVKGEAPDEVVHVPAEGSRLPEVGAEVTLDKEEITAELNRIIGENHAVSSDWISEAELDAQPELVKTMSVQPPRGAGKIRLIKVANVDLQPCGGTHVRNTSEIGAVRVRKIEKKGRQNRRVSLEFAE